MKEGFRQSMAWLHTWSGLSMGWLLYFIFLTGTLGYFDTEIDRWMQPELPLRGVPMTTAEAVSTGIERLRQAAPGADQWKIEAPNRNRTTPPRITWRMPPTYDGAQHGNEPLGASGENIEPRWTGGGQLLYQMHYRLHYLDVRTAGWIVGFAAMFMLVAITSGVITHRRIFRDFFTLRPGRGQRSWLDAHNALGVAALPFHVMITYSGLVFFMFIYLPTVAGQIDRFDDAAQAEFFDMGYSPGISDAPRSGIPRELVAITPLVAAAAPHGRLLSVTVQNPGDANALITVIRERYDVRRGTEQLVFDGVTGARIDTTAAVSFPAHAVNDTLIGLHEGLFAGPMLRWLYFLSGLVGTAVVATGLILWTAKRRARQAQTLRDQRGLWLMERLNAGVITGLLMGIGAYLLANRLLPVDMPARGLWEPHMLFATWAVATIYALFLPPRQAWTRLLAMTSGIFLLLPLVNALTTQRHLGVTLPHGDWQLAGVDLTAIAAALAFAFAARALNARHAGNGQ